MTTKTVNPGPFLRVLDYRVETRNDVQIIMAVFLHEGQVFNFYMKAGQALALAGELESAYQDLHAPVDQGGAS